MASQDTTTPTSIDSDSSNPTTASTTTTDSGAPAATASESSSGTVTKKAGRSRKKKTTRKPAAKPDSSKDAGSQGDSASESASADGSSGSSRKKSASKRSSKRKTSKKPSGKKKTVRKKKSAAAADATDDASGEEAADVVADAGSGAPDTSLEGEADEGRGGAADEASDVEAGRDEAREESGEAEAAPRKKKRKSSRKRSSRSSDRSEDDEDVEVSVTDPTADEIMVVNDMPGEECRIAILSKGHLEELFSERTETATSVGNIYKGRVTNVERAIQAAFVDYGAGANGFLHISDLHPKYFPGGDKTEKVGRKIPRRDRPPIQNALRRGDEILVQVLKEGIGTKGPTLTSYLSIPGRLLVMMPQMGRVGVSRKVEDEDQRREMRKILDDVDLPESFGFILRTAGLGRTKTEIKRDVAYLTRLWKVMEKRIETVGAPCALYSESDLLIRTVRDVLRPSIKAIVVDSASAYDRVSTFLSVIAPRSAPKVVQYRRSTPIFHAFDVERQIDLIHSRSVPLPSGGHLVIDQTEALVAIDVNSGKSRAARDSETNAYQTNCEAVDEIARQLRLRDLGGIIVNDLIDMRAQRHRRQVKERFANQLKRDRARTTILPISDLGLLEMTRQRMRPSLRKAHFIDCPHCDGHGEVKSPDSVGADAVRQAGYILAHERVRRVELVCSPRVASVLLSRKRRELVRIEDQSGKRIDVRVSDGIPVDRVDTYAYDDRNADIEIGHLPAQRMPQVEDLEAEAEIAAATGADDEYGSDARSEGGGVGRRKRRRRRRGSGPADATAIAMAGGFDVEEEDGDDEVLFSAEPAPRAASTPDAEERDGEEDGSGRKRRRRRRRRRRGGGEEAAAAATADGALPEAEPKAQAPEAAAAANGSAIPMDDKPVRVHVLAKELGVTSREILDRCEAMDGVEVKNHMSSLDVEVSHALRVELTPEATTEAVAAPQAAEDTDAAEAAHATDAADGTEAAAPSAPTGEEDGEPRKRRRRRRGGRGRRRRGRGEDGEGAAEGGHGESGARKSDSNAAAGASERSDDVSVEPKADAVPAAPAEAPAEGDAAGDAPGGKEKRKRRTLYRNRGRVAPGSRETMEADA